VQTPSLDTLFRVLEVQLELYVAETARHRIFVHAGVVGWHGRAIVLPGRTFSGKTTLVAALIRAGATYYSDEYAVLDVRGWVHPYTRPLSIREEGKAQGVNCPPERLGARSGTRPLPVGLVALSEYRRGARWRARSLSPGQAVLALLANTVPARSRPAAALEALQRVVAHATTLRAIRGEAEETVDALLRNMTPGNRDSGRPGGGDGRRAFARRPDPISERAGKLRDEHAPDPGSAPIAPCRRGLTRN
jgi:hypothetical protein